MDSLFADVSEFQCPVDDSYPHQILSLRSNDGTYQDKNFAANYRWAAAAADAGKLACFIVYMYWRPNWQDTINTHMQMVKSVGGPHPKMITMLDVESGGNPDNDQSAGINATFQAAANWLGDPRKVIGYANTGDFGTMWPSRPAGLRVIGAGYGSNPMLPGQIAHQYTDGQSDYGQGLPFTCPPFGSCDMNCADGLSPQQFAAACGIGAAMTPDELVLDQLGGPGTAATGNFTGWPQLGGHTVVDALAVIGQKLGIDGFTPPGGTK